MGESDVGYETPNRGGCLRALIAAPALAVLAPAAALYRSWAKMRRGSAVLVSVRSDSFERPGAAWARVSTTVDVPHSADGCRLITECVVLVAETLRANGQVFHLVYREPGREETIALPVGVAVQDLAERLIISCRRAILDGKTIVWPVLRRGHHIGQCLDPVNYDPEAPGEPDALLRSAPMTWALVLNRRRKTASTLFSMDFVVPEDDAERVESIVSRLRVDL